MTIDLDETLELANSMYQQSQDTEEVVRRNIVGRLYYGIFHLARDAADLTSSGADVHQKLIEHYRPRNRAVSNKLYQLRDLRNRADYDLNSTVTMQELKRAHRQCADIRRHLV